MKKLILALCFVTTPIQAADEKICEFVQAITETSAEFKKKGFDEQTTKETLIKFAGNPKLDSLIITVVENVYEINFNEVFTPKLVANLIYQNCLKNNK